MKVGVLLSSGKDSMYAAYKASKENELVCLIAIKSKNLESYMFHIPNIDLVKLQAKAIELPLIFIETQGIKEEELKDLENAVEIAKAKYKIQGLVSGAIQSNYQKTRINNICEQLNLESLTPLWHINAELYITDLIKNFNVIITGIAAEGLTEDLLGTRIGLSFIEKMKFLKVNFLGEGGEIETLVLDCPLFKKKIEIEEAEKIMDSEFSGIYKIKKAKLVS